MGNKRSIEKMEELRQRLFDGMADRGLTGDAAETVWTQLQAFANYGFPVLSPNRHLSGPKPCAA
jgi:error-prone DNA polymerase